MLKALTPLAAALPLAAIGTGTAAAATTLPTPTAPNPLPASAQHPSTHLGGPHIKIPVALQKTSPTSATSPASPASPTSTPSAAPTVPAPIAAPKPGAAGAFAVYGGYMDDHHHGSTKPKPTPWQGDPNVVFDGQADTASGGWDSSAVRVDNLSAAPEQISITVDIGKSHFALWSTQTVLPGQSAIFAQMGNGTFDGSDTNPAGGWGADPTLCQTSVSPTVPVVHVTVDGTTTDVQDLAQVLDTGGVDAAGCPYTGARADESESWTRL